MFSSIILYRKKHKLKNVTTSFTYCNFDTMKFGLLQEQTKYSHYLYIIDNIEQISGISNLSTEEITYITDCINADKTLITVNKYSNFVYVYYLKAKPTEYQTTEVCRKAGADVQSLCNANKATEIVISNLSTNSDAAVKMAEGIGLANYQFLKYRSEAGKLKNTIETVLFAANSASIKQINKLEITIDAIYKARTLVNEPVIFMTAEQLANEFMQIGTESGFNVTILNKEQIIEEKMGGLLAVNYGSKQPPTFTIMEYKPENCINQKPIVLIGKGIVYDTGGLSLKPTPASMDRMKSDMSGSAIVSTALYAITKMKLPLHIIALVPATDNRPGENAYTPGDVITMYSGKTVEVLNTDAEGRMILADALHWAKRYEPELVIDFATLTGAASVAVGEHGIVCMGTAEEKTKKAFFESGNRQYERLIEYPLWEEYGEQIKSDIADIKNVGGANGGAITAGKFLEHFVGYPWMHFDIAGVSFSTAKKGYIPVGGTAFGLRMLLDFLINYNLS